jgi:hypothetical protein
VVSVVVVAVAVEAAALVVVAVAVAVEAAAVVVAVVAEGGKRNHETEQNYENVTAIRRGRLDPYLLFSFWAGNEGAERCESEIVFQPTTGSRGAYRCGREV